MLRIKNSLGEKRMLMSNNGVNNKKYSLKGEENVFKNPKIKSINSLEGLRMKVKGGIN